MGIAAIGLLAARDETKALLEQTDRRRLEGRARA